MLFSSHLAADLTAALDDEYRARASYQAIVDFYGDVTPFANILQAEGRHIAALLPLFARYGVPQPADRWLGNIPLPISLVEACQAGIEGEISNYQMYDQFLTRTYENDVRQVFTQLRNASAYQHLPAFQTCLQSYQALPDFKQTYVDSKKSRTDLGAFLGFGLGLATVWWLVRINKNKHDEVVL